MSEPHVYRTRLEWKEGRIGTETPPELPALNVATPPEFPGGVAGIWSPEHLYIAAAEVCLMTTFLAIAENSKFEFVSYRSEAEGILAKTDAGFQITRIVIRPEVVVPGSDAIEKAHRLVEKAEKYCLISNSMKTEVELDISVRTV